MATSEPVFYSIPETARLLGVSESTVWRYVRAGREGGGLETARLGNRVLVTASGLREIVDSAVAAGQAA